MKKTYLTRYLVEQKRLNQHISPELRLMLEVVARACKRISQAVNKGALGEVMGSADSSNVQGEVQKKLDIIANEVLIEANEWGCLLYTSRKCRSKQYLSKIPGPSLWKQNVSTPSALLSLIHI